MSSMILYSSGTSPYVRKARVLILEAGLSDQVEVRDADVWGDPETFGKINPIGKIPALQTEDITLFDSPLVCEYLDSLHSGTPFFPKEGPARWKALRLHALGDGILDAAVGSVIESLRRPKELVYQGFLDNQLRKIKQTLALLETEADDLDGDLTIGGITLACALGYLDLRQADLGWRDSHPKLAAWYAKMAERPSMKATEPKA